MIPRSRFALTVAALVAFALPLAGGRSRAAQETYTPPFKPGQSFCIVVVRSDLDTSLFRVCDRGERSRADPDFPGQELKADREAASDDEAAIKDRIEGEFRKQDRYRLAPADRADYVLFVEAISTWARPSKDGAVPEGDALSRRAFSWATGRSGNEQSIDVIVSIVVPAAAFAAHTADAAALLKARVWEGASVAGYMQSASPEDVVLQLHGRPPNQTNDRSPADRAAKGPPPASRLNGRAVCAAPQPPVAPGMRREQERASDAGIGPVAGAAGRPNPSGAERPTFTARVVAVAVPVVASNERGGFVGGLKATDFSIFEDDVPQRIDRMVAESEPFTAALVVDTSFSMLPRMAEVKAAASAFLDALRPADRALAVGFDNRTWLLCDVTGNKNAVRQAVERLRPSGPLSRLHDALDVANTQRLEEIAGRKAMIVLTDGMDVGSRLVHATTVLTRLETANVPVYPVQFESKEPSGMTRVAPRKSPPIPSTNYFDLITSPGKAREYLEQLARNTGGLFQPASTPEAMLRAFRRAADDMRSQYVLYYYPTNQAQDATFRQIRVEVARPGVVVRARAGYRAPGAGK